MNDKHVSNACLVYESQSVYDVRTCVYEYDTSVCVCSECIRTSQRPRLQLLPARHDDVTTASQRLLDVADVTSSMLLLLLMMMMMT